MCKLDSYGTPLIMQQHWSTWQRKIDSEKVFLTQRNLEILYIFYLTYLRLERDEELKKHCLGVNASFLLGMNHFRNSQYNSWRLNSCKKFPMPTTGILSLPVSQVSTWTMECIWWGWRAYIKVKEDMCFFCSCFSRWHFLSLDSGSLLEALKNRGTTVVIISIGLGTLTFLWRG